MARRADEEGRQAFDGSEPPAGTPRPGDGVVAGVALNQPTQDGPPLAVDPDEPIAAEGPREGVVPLAIRDLAPAPRAPRRSPRFRLPKG